MKTFRLCGSYTWRRATATRESLNFYSINTSLSMPLTTMTGDLFTVPPAGVKYDICPSVCLSLPPSPPLSLSSASCIVVYIEYSHTDEL